MADHPSRTPHRVSETRVSRLIHWFSRHARDLPWRRTTDPYAIWVSEIMLQQTQVGTVMPFWERWMRALPDIAGLAAAKPDQVLKLWEGLGYYQRARNLQKAAREIMNLHGGEFPRDFETILALPGIGRYTAGAIASMAFNQPRPILDGNVIRVLTRLFGITTDPREKKTNAQLWQLADVLVQLASRITHHAAPCSHLNQSLMELGALICTPRSPQCDACPLRRSCLARRGNLQERIPTLRKRDASTTRRVIAFVVERDGEWLVRRRPDGAVNARLWEFPNVEMGVPKGGAQRTVATGRANGFQLTSTQPMCTIKHSITRSRITLQAFRARLGKPLPAGRWFSPARLAALPFTAAHKKVLGRLITDRENHRGA